MGQTAYNHFVTKCELFEKGVAIFAEAFFVSWFDNFG